MILTFFPTILLFFLVFLTYKLVLAHNELQTQIEEIRAYIVPNTPPRKKEPATPTDTSSNTTEEMSTKNKPTKAGKWTNPKAQDEHDPESGLDRFQDNLEKILPKMSTLLPRPNPPSLIEAFERDQYGYEHVAKSITPKVEDAFVTTIKPQHYRRSSSRGWKKLLNTKIETEIAHPSMTEDSEASSY